MLDLGQIYLIRGFSFSPIVISKDIHTQPSMVAVLSSEPGQSTHESHEIDGILSDMADIKYVLKNYFSDGNDNVEGWL